MEALAAMTPEQRRAVMECMNEMGEKNLFDDDDLVDDHSFWNLLTEKLPFNLEFLFGYVLTCCFDQVLQKIPP
ncbi:unnamed protein product [Gongylonema pulchrum]|uniref:Rab3 GTPase-activating protein catalytic subunit n=1 Tax=Gongylonema pulchrum TaxID=637853 RepID=A0A183EUI2_9BILA|nr:unnamed protein product [Gongylonema pulchrum]